MYSMRPIRWKVFFVSLGIHILVWYTAGLSARNASALYASLKQPPFAPPSFLFAIAWAILYLLMTFAAFLIYISFAEFSKKKRAIWLYTAQLIFNVTWPVLFFECNWYLFSLIWLIVLWVLIAMLMQRVYKINHLATWCLLPYLLWTGFSVYLMQGSFY